MSKSPLQASIFSLECEVRSSAERKGPIWEAVGRRRFQQRGKTIKDISESGKLTRATV